MIARQGGSERWPSWLLGAMALWTAPSAVAQTVTVPFATVGATVPVPIPPWAPGLLSLLLAVVAGWTLRRRLRGWPLAVLLLTACALAGTSGAWIPRVLAAGAGVTGFDLVGPSPTTSPVLLVGADVAVRNATGRPVRLQTPLPSVGYALGSPGATPGCAAGVELPSAGSCYLRLVTAGPVNQAPVANAGADQGVTLPAMAALSGSATDDGLPNPPGVLTFGWSKVSGPGTVTFGDASLAATTASFSVAGVYVLRLAASDGALAGTDDVTITVNGAAGALQFGPVADRSILVGAVLRTVLTATTQAPGPVGYSFDAAPTGAVIGPGGSIAWTPGPAQLGPSTFTVRATDSHGATTTTSFVVSVSATNHPPQLAAQADATLPVGNAFTRTLTATDPDAGDVLRFSLVSAPAGMTLVGANLSWPTGGVSIGDYPVIVKVTDAGGLSDTRQFVVGLLPPASPPVANDDRYEVRLGQVLSVNAAQGVLANDVDPMGGTLAAAKLTDPDKGSLATFSADGSFSYQAPAVLPAPAFQPVVRLTTPLPSPNYLASFSLGGLVAADVNGDGKADFVSAGFLGGVLYLFAVSGADASILWSLPISVSTPLPAPYADCRPVIVNARAPGYALGDIDDDGHPELVVPAQCDRDNQTVGNQVPIARYLALDARNGHVKWLSPVLAARPDIADASTGGNAFSLPFSTQPTIARLAPGEKPSVLFARTLIGTWGGQNACLQLADGHADAICQGVIALDGQTGGVTRRYYAPLAQRAQVNEQSMAPPLVADLDQSGALEVIAGSAVWNLDGSIRFAAPDRAAAHAALGNLDGSGTIQLVRTESDLATDSAFPARARAYRPDGSILWQFHLPDGAGWFGTPTVVDFDASGHPGVLVTSDNTLYAIDYRGQLRWTYAVTPSPQLPYAPRIQALDLDNDGVPEILVPVIDALVFLDGATGRVKHTLNYAAATGLQPSGAQAGVGERPLVVDTLGNGHAEVAVLWLPSDLNPRLSFVTSASNDWPPVPRQMAQEFHFPGSESDAAAVPATYANPFATASTNVYGVQPRLAPPVDPRQRQQASFTYRAQAGGLASNVATVRITIPPQNRPPAFVSIPPTRYLATSAFSQTPFTYAAQATDPDPGDVVTYGLYQRAGNNSCNAAANGVLSCTLFGNLDQQFVLSATDLQGAVTYQTIVLMAASASAVAPDVVGQAQGDAFAALAAAGLVVGALTEVDDSAPAGHVLSTFPSAGTSLLQGEAVALTVSKGPPPVPVPLLVGRGSTAAQALLRANGFTAVVQYEFSATAAALTVLGQSVVAGTLLAPTPGNPVTLTVSLGVMPAQADVARIAVSPATDGRRVGEDAGYTATAIYADRSSADVTYAATWSSTNSAVAAISGPGTAHAAQPGSTTIRAAFGGQVGQADLQVKAVVAGDATAGVASIVAPAGGSTVTGITPITGTATDANFVRYELAVAASADDAFVTFATGNAPVANGTLASFDPTLLQNGAYVLRLTVYDAGGNTATATQGIVVDGGQKVGLFTLSYDDLTVALSGLPIQITRNYDNRDKRQGDFGIGWRLGIDALRLSSSGVLGDGWHVVQQGQSYLLVPDGGSFVSVTLPSGRVETFDLQLAPNSSYLQPFSTVQAHFVARAGVQGTLQPLDNANLLVLDPQPGAVTLVDDTTLNTFSPDRFVYTQRDGTQYLVSRTRGVQSVRDTSGNAITISAAGIAHSSGTSIAFTRDAEGRIVGITDPAGRQRTYAYSPAGDLATATDRTGSATRYYYDTRHGLQRIDDPLGRPVSRADYDEAGRLIALTNRAGQRVTYAHDLPGRQEVVTDAMGRVTVLTYDQRGNVLTNTDPLGRTTQKTYDARDNLLTVTDPLGAVTSYAYSASDDLLAITDPLGRITTFTYDAGGRVLTRTDARGMVTVNHYDAAGRLVGTTDALGRSTATAYDGSGNQVAYTDPVGAVSTNQFDGGGRRTRVIDAAGTATDLFYDAAGRLATQQATGAPAAALAYDPEGRIVGTQFGAVSRQTTRDATGAIASVTTQAGAAVLVDYDAAGRFAGLRDATTGTALRQQTADAAGNLTSVTDALGNTTQFVYDAADQLVRTVFADGSQTSSEYDAAGRVVRRIDALGRATLYQYDAAGQLTQITDALGGQTHLQYDAGGSLISRTDPAGRVTTYQYDGAGQLTRTTYPDNTSESTVYDAAGRVAQRTDAAGQVTRYAYDALGRLLAVTNPLGGVTSYQYTGSGPRNAVIDAKGSVTRFAYDDHERVSTVTQPLGEATTFTYDDGGRVLTRTNGAGETTTFVYDVQGRLAKIKRADGSVADYSHTADGLVSAVADARGTTSYAYDAATRRLLRVTEPDGRYVRYQYDAAGNRTLLAHANGGAEAVTTYAYDALDRLVAVTDPNGGMTTLSLDAVGNVASIIRPNGVTTLLSHDARDRVAGVVQRDGGNALLFQETYLRDAVGNRIRVTAADGSHVDYGYDALGRVVGERRFDPANVLLADLGYGFDAVGNRTLAGPVAAPASYSYNANHQLVAGGNTSYLYDAAGRRIQESWPAGGASQVRRYRWDGEDRLLGFDDSSTGTTANYSYDDTGNRVSKTLPAGTTAYLIDRQSLTSFAQVLRAGAPGGESTFVWGTQLLQLVDAGTPRYPLADSLGSTRRLTGANGAVTDSYDFTAWGGTLAHVGSTAVPHGFAGELADAESGLIQLRARYYDPRTGVFLSRDPAAGNTFDPISLHPYLYADGNPVNRTDPSGQYTLAELQTVQQQQMTVEKYNEIRTLRDSMQRTWQAVATAMRDAGAVLAVEAIVQSTQDPRPLMQWFGGILGAVLGAPHTPKLNFAQLALASPAGSSSVTEMFNLTISATEEAITRGAEFALGKAAFDMFSRRDVSIGIGSAGNAPSGTTFHGDVTRTCASEPGMHAYAIKGATEWGLGLCNPFFGNSPLPQPGRISMAGVMVHEFMHIASNRLIRDDAYGCGDGRITPKKPSVRELLASELPGANLFSADSYRCWVEESFTGTGALGPAR